MGWLTAVCLTGPAGNNGHWRAVTKQILRFGLSAQAFVFPCRISHNLCEGRLALGLAYGSFSVKIRLFSILFSFTQPA